MKQLFVSFGFFITTPFFLVFSAFFLLFISQQKMSPLGVLVPTQPFSYAALPSNLNLISVTINQGDNRIGKLIYLLNAYNSPLSQYAPLIVTEADKYNIDYRLLTAIALQESGGCAKEILGTHNCWGYGIYKGKTTAFSSYEEAIDRITRYFASLKNKGIVSLDQIGALYNPSDHNNWKANIASFMVQL